MAQTVRATARGSGSQPSIRTARGASPARAPSIVRISEIAKTPTRATIGSTPS